MVRRGEKNAWPLDRGGGPNLQVLEHLLSVKVFWANKGCLKVWELV